MLDLLPIYVFTRGTVDSIPTKYEPKTLDVPDLTSIKLVHRQAMHKLHVLLTDIYAKEGRVHYQSLLFAIGAVLGATIREVVERNGAVPILRRSGLIAAENAGGDKVRAQVNRYNAIQSLLMPDKSFSMSVGRMFLGLVVANKSPFFDFVKLQKDFMARRGSPGWGRAFGFDTNTPTESAFDAIDDAWPRARAIFEPMLSDIDVVFELAGLIQNMLLIGKLIYEPAKGAQVVLQGAIATAFDERWYGPFPKHGTVELGKRGGSAWAEISDRLCASYDPKSPHRLSVLLGAIGALGGFAAQQAVWKTFIEPRDLNPGQYLLYIRAKNGDLYYYGETINRFIMETGADVFCFYTFVAGAIPNPTDERRPNLNEMFAYTAGVIGSERYGKRRFIRDGDNVEHVEISLKRHWKWVSRIMDESGHPSSAWPAILGQAAQHIISKVASSLDPTVAARLVMDSAIAMSKFDPKKVPGATSGLIEPKDWVNTAAFGGEPVQKRLISEVHAALPKSIPRA